MDHARHILLFENCQLTRGHSRTLLVDFQRNRFEFIPNELETILTQQSRKLNIKNILLAHKDISENVLEYFDFLLSEEYAFLCDADEIELFPLMDQRWENPGAITNCIVDIGPVPLELSFYKSLFEQLSELGCEVLQIRNYKSVPLTFFNKLIKLLSSTVIHKVYMVVAYNTAHTREDYKTFVGNNLVVNEMLVHSSKEEEIGCALESNQRISFIKRVIAGNECCGRIGPEYFNFDLKHFLESKTYNTCLNRKISIDTGGEIKNCPSLTKGYGNIAIDKLTAIISDPEFKSYWHIQKDQVSVCNSCEFRHVCTDCRAFQDKDHNFEKPAKCKYDPVEGLWVEDAIKRMRMDKVSAVPAK